MRKLGTAVIAFGGLWLVRTASAQDTEPPPDLDFLEYLGSWQGRDDEWLAIAEWDKDHPADAERRVGRRAPRANDSEEDGRGAAADPPPQAKQGNGP